jgi:hypothetical protein
MEDTNLEFQDTQEPEVTSISLEDLLSSFFSTNILYSDQVFTNDNFDINGSLLFRNYMYNTMDDMLMEEVLRESLETQPDLVKTDKNIIIASQKFSSLCEKVRGQNKECSICITAFENEDFISITNCNHIFHTDCIKEWAKYKTDSDCPVCREKIE